MLDKSKIQELSNKIKNIVSDSPIEDMEDNINALLQGMFTKLKLISREEFDVQTGVLRRTREKLEALEEKLEILETKLKK
jgi:BMFP domain-containing protein YqiC|tara:strand:- start:1925 stop:2164 length:240 start_codon:yes stop_codon:yes gene_type:complete